MEASYVNKYGNFIADPLIWDGRFELERLFAVSCVPEFILNGN